MPASPRRKGLFRRALETQLEEGGNEDEPLASPLSPTHEAAPEVIMQSLLFFFFKDMF